MQIQYLDNYDEQLLEVDSPYMPRVGDSVYIGNVDEWIVTKVYWNADSCIGSVILTLADEIPAIRENKQDKTSDRLNEMQASIMAVQRNHDELRKKHRGLRDQVSSVRGGINRQAQEDKKPS